MYALSARFTMSAKSVGLQTCSNPRSWSSAYMFPSSSVSTALTTAITPLRSEFIARAPNW